MIPERIQANMSHIGDGSPRAMLAETMKIPDPIIDPATSIVPSVRDIALTNPWLDCGVASVAAAELLMQGLGKREGDRRQGRRRFSGNPEKCRVTLGGPLGRAVYSRATESLAARTCSRLAPSCGLAFRRDACLAGSASRAALRRGACCSRRHASA